MRCISHGLDTLPHHPSPELRQPGRLAPGTAALARSCAARASAEMQRCISRSPSNFMIPRLRPLRDCSPISYPTLASTMHRTQLICAGAVWTEQTCGTGLGTAAYLKRPIVVHGREYFFARYNKSDLRGGADLRPRREFGRDTRRFVGLYVPPGSHPGAGRDGCDPDRERPVPRTTSRQHPGRLPQSRRISATTLSAGPAGSRQWRQDPRRKPRRARSVAWVAGLGGPLVQRCLPRDVQCIYREGRRPRSGSGSRNDVGASSLRRSKTPVSSEMQRVPRRRRRRQRRSRSSLSPTTRTAAIRSRRVEIAASAQVAHPHSRRDRHRQGADGTSRPRRPAGARDRSSRSLRSPSRQPDEAELWFGYSEGVSPEQERAARRDCSGGRTAAPFFWTRSRHAVTRRRSAALPGRLDCPAVAAASASRRFSWSPPRNANRRSFRSPRPFRSDLLFRLNTLEVYCCRYGAYRFRRDRAPPDAEIDPAVELSQGAIDRLAELNWDGNIRELRNVLARLSLSGSGHVIDKAVVEADLRARSRDRRRRLTTEAIRIARTYSGRMC